MKWAVTNHLHYHFCLASMFCNYFFKKKGRTKYRQRSGLKNDFSFFSVLSHFCFYHYFLWSFSISWNKKGVEEAKEYNQFPYSYIHFLSCTSHIASIKEYNVTRHLFVFIRLQNKKNWQNYSYNRHTFKRNKVTSYLNQDRKVILLTLSRNK